MNLNDASIYFRKGVNDLRRACADGTPWVFLCASAFVEYLSKLVDGEDKGGNAYKKFVKDYMSQANPLYRDFVFKNGERDLDVQMYHVLRCGIVHSFSLIPNDRARKADGRDRSIVLCHAKERDEYGWKHLMQYPPPGIETTVDDAAFFVAEDFVDDIAKVTELIFAEAVGDRILRGNIEKWLCAQPPIIGGL